MHKPPRCCGKSCHTRSAILNRVNSKIKNVPRDNKNGLRTGQRCRDHIFLMRQSIEKKLGLSERSWFFRSSNGRSVVVELQWNRNCSRRLINNNIGPPATQLSDIQLLQQPCRMQLFMHCFLPCLLCTRVTV